MDRELDLDLEKREPILGPNAKAVAIQFATILVLGYAVSWLLWDWFYSIASYFTAPLFR